MGSSGAYYESAVGNILMTCGFIGISGSGGVNREFSLIDVNFPGANGDKIGLTNKFIVEDMIFFEGSVMHVAKLKA